MKTENEFSEYFERTATQQLHLSTSQQEKIKEISKSHWADLTSHLSFYFSNEDRLQISAKAATLFQTALMQQSEVLEAWKDVLRDFNKNNFWNFKQIMHKPKIAQTEDQKIFWKLFKYGWAFFQSMIILKIAVYYFGLESATNPDQTNVLWVWVFFSLSVSSLVFFAYRNRHDKG